MERPPLLSLVIPAYNEGGRIGGTVARVCAYLDRQPYTWEVIVVIDGGGAGPADEARAAAGGRANVHVLENDVNRGKGYSVRRGFAGAHGGGPPTPPGPPTPAPRGRGLGGGRGGGGPHGGRLVFIDADLSLPVEGLEPMMARFDQGADVVIGSREVPGAQVAGDPPRLRGVMGRIFNRVVQALALPGLADTQCGFKGFRAEAARRIFAAQTVDRFGFDVEVLYLARRLGYRIDEQPVVCVYHGGSSVNRLGDVVGMLRDVFLIRWRHR